MWVIFHGLRFYFARRKLLFTSYGSFFYKECFFYKIWEKYSKKYIYILPISRNMWNIYTCFGCKYTLNCKTLMEVFPGTLRRNSIASSHVTCEKEQLHSHLLIFITAISCKIWIPNLFIYSSIKDMQPLISNQLFNCLALIEWPSTMSEYYEA